MMKLSTMKKVMETVDKEWRSPLGEKILENWGYDEGTVFFLRASANVIFIFKKDGKPYFLRFNDSSERELSAIEAELSILQYLECKSLNVALPVKSTNNKYIEDVETELGTFYAVVFEALEGKHLEFDDITEEQAYLWGKALGKLHEQLKQIPDAVMRKRPSWKDQLSKVKDQVPTNEIAALREYEWVVAWAEKLEVTAENYGIIHYDFELDNLVFNNNEIGMFDFDDASVCWYVADVVYALRDAGDFQIDHPITAAFIEGYQTETVLDLEILREASGFGRLHKLVSFVNLVRSVDVEESDEHPDWLVHLGKKLTHYIDEYRRSFEKFDN